MPVLVEGYLGLLFAAFAVGVAVVWRCHGAPEVVITHHFARDNLLSRRRPEQERANDASHTPAMGAHFTGSAALQDAAATRRLGAALADECRPGALILLGGQLGAGKTTLVDAFVRALGGAGATSPTFVLAHRYDGARLPIWHLDLYRLDDPSEAIALDLDAYASDDGVTIVEWFDRAPDAWPPQRLVVRLSIDGDARRAEIEGGGAYADVARRVCESVAM